MLRPMTAALKLWLTIGISVLGICILWLLIVQYLTDNPDWKFTLGGLILPLAMLVIVRRTDTKD